MSGNVEVVKAAIEAFNAADVERMLALADPQLEWRPAFGGATLGATVFPGHAGFRDDWRGAQEIWEVFRFEPEQFLEKDDQVVVIGRGKGRGRGSGVEIDQPLAMAWGVSAGKTRFGQTFAEPANALRAAGLVADQPHHQAS